MFVRIVRKFIYLVEVIFFWQDEILFMSRLALIHFLANLWKPEKKTKVLYFIKF